jgi:hypothetical protein
MSVLPSLLLCLLITTHCPLGLLDGLYLRGVAAYEDYEFPCPTGLLRVKDVRYKRGGVCAELSLAVVCLLLDG